MMGPQTTRHASPGGQFCIEVVEEFDERSGPWESVTIREVASSRVLAQLFSARPSADVAWTGDHTALLELNDHVGARVRVSIDAVQRTYSELPDGAPQPLLSLRDRLVPPRATEPPRGIGSAQTPRDFLKRSFGGAVLAAAGVWMAISAETTFLRGVGAFGVLLFGAATLFELRDLWKRSVEKRHGTAPITPSER